MLVYLSFIQQRSRLARCLANATALIEAPGNQGIGCEAVMLLQFPTTQELQTELQNVCRIDISDVANIILALFALHRVRGCEKVKRLIVIHAMTREGLLDEYEFDPSDILHVECPSAGIVTNKLCIDGFELDYHDTMNIKCFLKWKEKRSIRALQIRQDFKTMVLILDNVEHHHARGEE